MINIRSIIFVLTTCYSVIAAQVKSNKHENPSTIAFSIEEKDLFPEGIAYDSKTKLFFLSSISKEKIVALDRNGNQTDFIKPQQDGMLRSLGLKVDTERRQLWAVSNSNWGANIVSALHIYNIDSKKLVKKFYTENSSNAALNDLALMNNGSAYITDYRGNSIYYISPELDAVKLFLRSDSLLVGANGIAASNDNSFLYVASQTNGIVLLDLKTKAVQPIINKLSVDTKGIDGLMLYKNSLIGILSGDDDISKHYIARYQLSENGKEIISTSIIDQKNPLFALPTTGVVVDDELFCLAATYLHLFSTKKETDIGMLGNPFVLKYNLSKEFKE